MSQFLAATGDHGRVGLLWAALTGRVVRVCPRRRRLLGVRVLVLGQI